jgi:hypothetical protein
MEATVTGNGGLVALPKHRDVTVKFGSVACLGTVTSKKIEKNKKNLLKL